MDGVILESNAIKDEGFRQAYLPWGNEAAEAALALHRASPGKSRYEKFAMMHRRILGREIDAGELAGMGEDFAQRCFELIVACPMVPGAREFLQKHYDRIPLGIASATPETELLQIVKKRGLAAYFRWVFGTPASKSENLRKIAGASGVPAAEMVFVGDQLGDFQAAAELGMPFIGRIPEGAPDPFPGHAVFPRVADLSALDSWPDRPVAC